MMSRKAHFAVQIVFALFCFTHCQQSIDVEFSSSNLTWRQANKHCKLAGMELPQHLKITGLQVTIDNSSIPKQSWIGSYVERTDWLGLLGCVLGEPNESGIVLDTTENPVFACFKTCETGFMLTTNTCFCVDDVITNRTAKCKAFPCAGHPDSLCGENTNSSKHNSVCMCEYKTMTLNVMEGRGDCILRQEKGVSPMLRNEDCSAKHHSKCHIGDLHAPSPGEHLRNWSMAALFCQQIGKEFTYDYFNLASDVPVWVGILRSSMTLWGDPFLNQDSRRGHFGCLAAELKSDGTIIRTHEQNCNKPLPVMCEKQLVDFSPKRNDTLNSTINDCHVLSSSKVISCMLVGLSLYVILV